MKVIHIVENLDKGAVENWLVRMLRYAHDRGMDKDWTFYCALGEKGRLDNEVRRMGGKIIFSPVPLARNIAFVRALRAELKSGGYDVLHAHHDLVSAVYLVAAIGIPLKKRLVHVHNSDEWIPTSSTPKRAIMRPLLRWLGIKLSNGVIGISEHTLDTFLSGRPRRPGQDRVHYYGIDPDPFLCAKADRSAFRSELGLAENTLVVIFAGRLVPEKNPGFALEVLGEICSSEPNAAGVIVGNGSEEEELKERAREMDQDIRFMGWRSDIPDIMACCDCFLLPRPEHPKEGFGIAVVEAQLAGLRLLLSKGVPDDPLLPHSSVKRLSLAESAAAWAEVALELLDETPPSREQAAADLAESQMDMDRALQGLEQLHQL